MSPSSLLGGVRSTAEVYAGDPEPNAPAVVYWFELKRNANKSVDWIPHLVDDASGTGTQIMARDINRDGRPDIVVGNKRGTFVFTHQVKSVSHAEWEAAQPKPRQ